MNFPDFDNTEFTEHLTQALMKMQPIGLKTFQFLKQAEKWEDYYTFEKTDDKLFWIEELKGITFPTLQNARLYAFLDFCNKFSVILED